MRTTLMCLLVILASCASPATRVVPSTAWMSKADPDLSAVVHRYAEAEIDTTVTVLVVPSRTWMDRDRSGLIEGCGLQLADRLDSTVMVICPSRAIPCLGASDLVDGMLLSPPWSPDL